MKKDCTETRILFTIKKVSIHELVWQLLVIRTYFKYCSIDLDNKPCKISGKYFVKSFSYKDFSLYGSYRL